MNILKKGYNGEILVPINTVLLEQKIIFVEGEINQERADDFVKEIMYLSMTSNEPIKVIINSEGGSVDAGLRMCEAVSNCPCKVNAYCFGKAYSMAAILFESVNGERNMIANSRLMLHQPSIMGMQRGTAAEVEELSKQLNEKNELLLGIVADRCSWDLEKLKEETVRDRYFTATETVANGMADKVSDFMEMVLPIN